MSCICYCSNVLYVVSETWGMFTEGIAQGDYITITIQIIVTVYHGIVTVVTTYHIHHVQL